VGLPDGEKNFEDTCNRLDAIPAYDGRTDGRTDRQTNILPRHSPRYAYASRGNNIVCYLPRIFSKTLKLKPQVSK